MAKPKLVVFDLDYTLWPFWIDTHVDPPFRLDRGRVYDGSQKEIHHFPDVPAIFSQLQNHSIPIALASRTRCTGEAHSLVRMFGWDKVISYAEIYPGSKVPHFQNFHKQSGVRFDQMLFFDDEHRNIEDISKLGVTSIHAHSGMSLAVLEHGLEEFARNNYSTNTPFSSRYTPQGSYAP